jgi:hypothetical protein
MVEAYSQLSTLVNATSKLMAKLGSIPAKTAGNKQVARAELVAITVKISNIMKDFAFVSKDENMGNFLIASESVLAAQLSHQALLDYCKNLLERVLLHLVPLQAYGMTNEMAEIYSLLANQLDPLMELFSEDKQFYMAYKSARMIVDPATRSRVVIE